MRREVVFAFPGDLDTPTGGYAYDRRMAAELRGRGWTVDYLRLSSRFPFPREADLADADAALAAVEDGALVLADGLAFGAMPAVAARHAERLGLVALVHHPLALEDGLDPDTAARLAASERAALETARRVVATSVFTARQLEAQFGVAEARLAVAIPGTEPGPPAAGEGEPPVLLTVGAVTPRKGHDVLAEALAGLTDIPWRWRVVGALDRSPATASRLREAVADLGLGERVEIAGQVPDVRAEIAAADLFVLPSRHEGYGMAFAEAMSQGLPVVGCATGAVPDLAPPEAGLLVPPGDAAALRGALRSVLSDRDLRRRLAAGARRAGAALPDWPVAAVALEAALLAAGE